MEGEAGLQLAEQKDMAGAKAAFQQAIDSRHRGGPMASSLELCVTLVSSRSWQARPAAPRCPRVVTPWLQNRLKLPGTVAHLGLRSWPCPLGSGPRRILLWSGLVVSLHLADGDLHIRRYLFVSAGDRGPGHRFVSHR